MEMKDDLNNLCSLLVKREQIYLRIKAELENFNNHFQNSAQKFLLKHLIYQKKQELLRRIEEDSIIKGFQVNYTHSKEQRKIIEEATINLFKNFDNKYECIISGSGSVSDFVKLFERFFERNNYSSLGYLRVIRNNNLIDKIPIVNVLYGNLIEEKRKAFDFKLDELKYLLLSEIKEKQKKYSLIKKATSKENEEQNLWIQSQNDLAFNEQDKKIYLKRRKKSISKSVKNEKCGDSHTTDNSKLQNQYQTDNLRKLPRRKKYKYPKSYQILDIVQTCEIPIYITKPEQMATYLMEQLKQKNQLIEKQLTKWNQEIHQKFIRRKTGYLAPQTDLKNRSITQPKNLKVTKLIKLQPIIQFGKYESLSRELYSTMSTITHNNKHDRSFFSKLPQFDMNVFKY